jgi:hypothetical protein
MMRCPSEPPPSLDEVIRRLRRLVPCWQDPTRFYRQRDDLVDDLHRLARSGSPGAPSPPAEASPQAQRLAALARFQAARITRLERQLAEACRPRPRQRHEADHRQMMLSF